MRETNPDNVAAELDKLHHEDWENINILDAITKGLKKGSHEGFRAAELFQIINNKKLLQNFQQILDRLVENNLMGFDEKAKKYFVTADGMYFLEDSRQQEE